MAGNSEDGFEYNEDMYSEGSSQGRSSEAQRGYLQPEDSQEQVQGSTANLTGEQRASLFGERPSTRGFQDGSSRGHDRGLQGLGNTEVPDRGEATGEESSDDPPKQSSRGYHAEDFADLPVSKEMKDLFQYITRYQPIDVQLDTVLKPFIPDYIPAIGDIDEFIKVPRPDGKPDLLGLRVLDEPAARQSDPSVLSLQLRQMSKRAGSAASAAEVVGRVEDARRNGQRIDEWIKSITALHKGKPEAAVHYSKNMPDIEGLMQEWPPQVEEMLPGIRLPDSSLDLDLRTYATLVCNLLDIPVYANPIESLHLLFSLLLEFKHNPAFHQPASTPSPGQSHMTTRMETPDSGARPSRTPASSSRASVTPLPGPAGRTYNARPEVLSL